MKDLSAQSKNEGIKNFRSFQLGSILLFAFSFAIPVILHSLNFLIDGYSQIPIALHLFIILLPAILFYVGILIIKPYLRWNGLNIIILSRIYLIVKLIQCFMIYCFISQSLNVSIEIHIIINYLILILPAVSLSLVWLQLWKLKSKYAHTLAVVSLVSPLLGMVTMTNRYQSPTANFLLTGILTVWLIVLVVKTFRDEIIYTHSSEDVSEDVLVTNNGYIATAVVVFVSVLICSIYKF